MNLEITKTMRVSSSVNKQRLTSKHKIQEVGVPTQKEENSEEGSKGGPRKTSATDLE